MEARAGDSVPSQNHTAHKDDKRTEKKIQDQRRFCVLFPSGTSFWISLKYLSGKVTWMRGRNTVSHKLCHITFQVSFPFPDGKEKTVQDGFIKITFPFYICPTERHTSENILLIFC